MIKRTVIRYLFLFSFMCFGIFLIFPPSISFSRGLNSDEVMQIQVKNDLLSVKLENASMQKVLQEIANQTNLKFEGLENAEGKVTQQFENIPLDEGLRKISQSFIMIFKKSGEKGEPLQVEKVIIIAKKGMSEDSSDSKATEKSRTSISSSSRTSSSLTRSGTTKSSKITSPSKITPPSITKSKEKEKGAAEIKVKEGVAEKETTKEREKEKKKEQLIARQREQSKSESKTEKPEKKTAAIPPKARVAKKTPPAAIKTISRASSTSSDLSRGEKYFKEKRWDRAIKYFKKYLEQNPSDLETQKRYTIAQENTDRAISLYKQARNLEKEEEFEEAYAYYKKSYAIYPLLYDTWERMRSIKKLIRK